MTHFDSAPEPSLDPPPNVAIGNQRAGSGRVGFWVSHLLGKAIVGLRRHLMAPAVGVQGGREERAVMGATFPPGECPGAGRQSRWPRRPSLQRRLRVRQGPRHCGRRHLQQLTRGAMAAGDVASDPTFFSRKNSWAAMKARVEGLTKEVRGRVSRKHGESFC